MKLKNIFILIILIFLSCFNNNNIMVLTDSKIIPFYVNSFNIDHNVSFIVKYRSFIDKYTIETENPDIIISKSLDNISINQYLKNIKDYYYSDYKIFNEITKQYSYKILPINFDFPILIYKNSYNIKKYINLEDLKELYIKFGQEKKIFISPYISKDLFYVLSEFNGASFNFSNETISYDEKNLQNTLNYIQSFLNEKEIILQKNFADKYGYLNLEKLLLSKNSILVAGLSNISFYKSLDKESGKDLNFSYLINNEDKTIISNLTFIGVKSLSNTTEKFIRWILDEKVEKRLIKLKDEAKFYDNLGLIDGFTAYKRLNLNLKDTIKEIPTFIIDENQIENQSYIMNAKNFEKEIDKINNWFNTQIENQSEENKLKN